MTSTSSITIPGLDEVPVVALGTIGDSFGPPGFGSDDEEPIFLSPLQRRLRGWGGIHGGGAVSMLNSLALGGLGSGITIRGFPGGPGGLSGGGGGGLGSRVDNLGSAARRGAGEGGTQPEQQQQQQRPTHQGLLDLHNRLLNLVSGRSPSSATSPAASSPAQRGQPPADSSESTQARVGRAGTGSRFDDLEAHGEEGGGEEHTGFGEDDDDDDGDDDDDDDEEEEEEPYREYSDSEDYPDGEEDAADALLAQDMGVDGGGGRAVGPAPVSGDRSTTGPGSGAEDDGEAQPLMAAERGPRRRRYPEPRSAGPREGPRTVRRQQHSMETPAASQAAAATATDLRVAAAAGADTVPMAASDAGSTGEEEVGVADGLMPSAGMAAPAARPRAPAARRGRSLAFALAAARFALSAVLAPLRLLMFVAGLSTGMAGVGARTVAARGGASGSRLVGGLQRSVTPAAARVASVSQEEGEAAPAAAWSVSDGAEGDLPRSRGDSHPHPLPYVRQPQGQGQQQPEGRPRRLHTSRQGGSAVAVRPRAAGASARRVTVRAVTSHHVAGPAAAGPQPRPQPHGENSELLTELTLAMIERAQASSARARAAIQRDHSDHPELAPSAEGALAVGRSQAPAQVPDPRASEDGGCGSSLRSGVALPPGSASEPRPQPADADGGGDAAAATPPSVAPQCGGSMGAGAASTPVSCPGPATSHDAHTAALPQGGSTSGGDPSQTAGTGSTLPSAPPVNAAAAQRVAVGTTEHEPSGPSSSQAPAGALGSPGVRMLWSRAALPLGDADAAGTAGGTWTLRDALLLDCSSSSSSGGEEGARNGARGSRSRGPSSVGRGPGTLGRPAGDLEDAGQSLEAPAADSRPPRWLVSLSGVPRRPALPGVTSIERIGGSTNVAARTPGHDQQRARLRPAAFQNVTADAASVAASAMRPAAAAAVAPTVVESSSSSLSAAAVAAAAESAATAVPLGGRRGITLRGRRRLAWPAAPEDFGQQRIRRRRRAEGSGAAEDAGAEADLEPLSESGSGGKWEEGYSSGHSSTVSLQLRSLLDADLQQLLGPGGCRAGSPAAVRERPGAAGSGAGADDGPGRPGTLCEAGISPREVGATAAAAAAAAGGSGGRAGPRAGAADGDGADDNTAAAGSGTERRAQPPSYSLPRPFGSVRALLRPARRLLSPESPFPLLSSPHAGSLPLPHEGPAWVDGEPRARGAGSAGHGDPASAIDDSAAAATAAPFALGPYTSADSNGSRGDAYGSRSEAHDAEAGAAPIPAAVTAAVTAGGQAGPPIGSHEVGSDGVRRGHRTGSGEPPAPVTWRQPALLLTPPGPSGGAALARTAALLLSIPEASRSGEQQQRLQPPLPPNSAPGVSGGAAVTAAAVDVGSCASGLWDGTDSEEEPQARQMRSSEGAASRSTHAIGPHATGHSDDDAHGSGGGEGGGEGAAHRALHRGSDGGGVARSRLRQLGGAGLFAGRWQRPQRRQALRPAWDDGEGDVDGVFTFYYSDGNTDHRALLDQTRRQEYGSNLTAAALPPLSVRALWANDAFASPLLPEWLAAAAAFRWDSNPLLGGGLRRVEGIPDRFPTPSSRPRSASGAQRDRTPRNEVNRPRGNNARRTAVPTTSAPRPGPQEEGVGAGAVTSPGASGSPSDPTDTADISGMPLSISELGSDQELEMYGSLPERRLLERRRAQQPQPEHGAIGAVLRLSTLRTGSSGGSAAAGGAVEPGNSLIGGGTAASEAGSTAGVGVGAVSLMSSGSTYGNAFDSASMSVSVEGSADASLAAAAAVRGSAAALYSEDYREVRQRRLSPLTAELGLAEEAEEDEGEGDVSSSQGPCVDQVDSAAAAMFLMGAAAGCGSREESPGGGSSSSSAQPAEARSSAASQPPAILCDADPAASTSVTRAGRPRASSSAIDTSSAASSHRGDEDDLDGLAEQLAEISGQMLTLGDTDLEEDGEEGRRQGQGVGPQPLHHGVAGCWDLASEEGGTRAVAAGAGAAAAVGAAANSEAESEGAPVQAAQLESSFAESLPLGGLALGSVFDEYFGGGGDIGDPTDLPFGATAGAGRPDLRSCRGDGGASVSSDGAAGNAGGVDWGSDGLPSMYARLPVGSSDEVDSEEFGSPGGYWWGFPRASLVDREEEEWHGQGYTDESEEEGMYGMHDETYGMDEGTYSMDEEPSFLVAEIPEMDVERQAGDGGSNAAQARGHRISGTGLSTGRSSTDENQGCSTGCRTSLDRPLMLSSECSSDAGLAVQRARPTQQRGPSSACGSRPSRSPAGVRPDSGYSLSTRSSRAGVVTSAYPRLTDRMTARTVGGGGAAERGGGGDLGRSSENESGSGIGSSWTNMWSLRRGRSGDNELDNWATETLRRGQEGQQQQHSAHRRVRRPGRGLAAAQGSDDSDDDRIPSLTNVTESDSEPDNLGLPPLLTSDSDTDEDRRFLWRSWHRPESQPLAPAQPRPLTRSSGPQRPAAPPLPPAPQGLQAAAGAAAAAAAAATAPTARDPLRLELGSAAEAVLDALVPALLRNRGGVAGAAAAAEPRSADEGGGGGFGGSGAVLSSTGPPVQALRGGGLLRPRGGATGGTPQILSAVIRLSPDALVNLPHGSVFSITLPSTSPSGGAGGGDASTGSTTANNNSNSGSSNPGGSVVGATVRLQLGGVASFPVSWRSYLPPEDTASGRHPNDSPGLPGTYEERDIPAWAARFAPRRALAPIMESDRAAGSAAGQEQEVERSRRRSEGLAGAAEVDAGADEVAAASFGAGTADTRRSRPVSSVARPNRVDAGGTSAAAGASARAGVDIPALDVPSSTRDISCDDLIASSLDSSDGDEDDVCGEGRGGGEWGGACGAGNGGPGAMADGAGGSGADGAVNRTTLVPLELHSCNDDDSDDDDLPPPIPLRLSAQRATAPAAGVGYDSLATHSGGGAPPAGSPVGCAVGAAPQAAVEAATAAGEDRPLPPPAVGAAEDSVHGTAMSYGSQGTRDSGHGQCSGGDGDYGSSSPPPVAATTSRRRSTGRGSAEVRGSDRALAPAVEGPPPGRGIPPRPPALRSDDDLVAMSLPGSDDEDLVRMGTPVRRSCSSGGGSGSTAAALDLLCAGSTGHGNGFCGRSGNGGGGASGSSDGGGTGGGSGSGYGGVDGNCRTELRLARDETSLVGDDPPGGRMAFRAPPEAVSRILRDLSGNAAQLTGAAAPLPPPPRQQPQQQPQQPEPGPGLEQRPLPPVALSEQRSAGAVMQHGSNGSAVGASVSLFEAGAAGVWGDAGPSASVARGSRGASAPARFPLPPMPSGSGAAPPTTTTAAGAAGVIGPPDSSGPPTRVTRYIETPMTALAAADAEGDDGGAWWPAWSRRRGAGRPGTGTGAGASAGAGSAPAPARRNAVTYPRGALLEMLEALVNAEAAFNALGTRGGEGVGGGANSGGDAPAPDRAGTGPGAGARGHVGGLWEAPRATFLRFNAQTAAAGVLLRDEGFVGRLLAGLPGVVTAPPTACVWDTVMWLAGPQEGLLEQPWGTRVCRREVAGAGLGGSDRCLGPTG